MKISICPSCSSKNCKDYFEKFFCFDYRFQIIRYIKKENLAMKEIELIQAESEERFSRLWNRKIEEQDQQNKNHDEWIKGITINPDKFLESIKRGDLT